MRSHRPHLRVMVPELHVLEKACARIPGALKRLVLVDPDDLASQPDWHLVPNVDDLDFSPGKAGYEFEADILRSSLKDNHDTSSDAGDFFEYTLEASARHIRGDVELLRAKLRNRRIHVVATYYDGEQRLLPFVRLAISSDTAARPSGRNGYSIRGISRYSHPAPFLDGTFNVIGGDVDLLPESALQGEMTMDSMATSAASDTFDLPANVLLTAIFVKSNSGQTVSVGLTPGGDELGGPQDLLANEGHTFAQSFRSTEVTTLHFSGMAGSNAIEVWYAQLGAGDVVVIAIETTDAEYEYEVPGSVLLAAVWVRGTLAQTVSVGLTSGGNELGGPQDLTANEPHTFAQSLRTGAATSVFISGLTGTNSIEIWYYL